MQLTNPLTSYELPYCQLNLSIGLCLVLEQIFLVYRLVFLLLPQGGLSYKNPGLLSFRANAYVFLFLQTTAKKFSWQLVEILKCL